MYLVNKNLTANSNAEVTKSRIFQTRCVKGYTAIY